MNPIIQKRILCANIVIELLLFLVFVLLSLPR